LGALFATVLLFPALNVLLLPLGAAYRSPATLAVGWVEGQVAGSVYVIISLVLLPLYLVRRGAPLV
jgi:hypothetical protein